MASHLRARTHTFSRASRVLVVTAMTIALLVALLPARSAAASTYNLHAISCFAFAPGPTLSCVLDIGVPPVLKKTPPFPVTNPFRNASFVSGFKLGLGILASPGDVIEISIENFMTNSTCCWTRVVTFTFTPPPDTTPPALVLEDLSVPATSPAGAAVEYFASATDDVDGAVPVSCSPASGSAFPVGPTTVDCSATDTAGNTGTGSFTVTVLSAAAQAEIIATLITSATQSLPAGTQTSLLSSLTAAQASLESGSATAACGQLGSFTNKVSAQSGKSIDAGLAAQLLSAARQIESSAGCQ